jgi:hypothetical protein
MTGMKLRLLKYNRESGVIGRLYAHSRAVMAALTKFDPAKTPCGTDKPRPPGAQKLVMIGRIVARVYLINYLPFDRFAAMRRRQ